MSIQLLSFIFGGFLIGIALLGGGIEVREIKIPPLARTGRVLSFCGGIAFLALAIFNPDVKPRPDDGKPNPAVPVDQPKLRQTFEAPMNGDLRLDYCFEFGTHCGQEPATEWCKMKGFTRAVEFPSENVGGKGENTRLIGPQAVCQGTFCTSFRYIVCER